MNELRRYIIKGIYFVIILGTLSHFIYEWSGNNPFMGLFFPVNESIWEHMKLCFFPMLLYALYMNNKLKTQYPCVSSALLYGVLLSTAFIPIIFYTYFGILGFHNMVLDIGTFILSVLLSFYRIYQLTLSCRLKEFLPALKLILLVIMICFWVFTYHPPVLALFSLP